MSVIQKLTPDGGDEPSREFELQRGEFVADGIRRIARGQLDDAGDQLSREPSRKLDKAVHESRKSLKRLRATLRISRSAIGDETYQAENGTFRDLGRRLSGPRDAAVLIETLDHLNERFADELPKDSTAGLRERLEGNHDREVGRLRDDETTIAEVRGGLEEARLRAAAWTFEKEGFDALEPGLKRIYRRGRRRMRAARKEPTTERLHEWRKRTKDLWHAAQIVRPAAPERMTKLASRVHDLSDLLGDDHDLAVLREHVVQRPEGLDDPARAALLSVIDRRRAALQRDAFKLGRKLYRRPPKRFVGRIRRDWRKRNGKRPQPVAG